MNMFFVTPPERFPYEIWASSQEHLNSKQRKGNGIQKGIAIAGIWVGLGIAVTNISSSTGEQVIGLIFGSLFAALATCNISTAQ